MAMNIELAGTFLGSSRRGASSRVQLGCMSVKQRSAPGCVLDQKLGRRLLSGTKPERLWLRPECNSFVSLRASCDCGSARQQVALPAGHHAGPYGGWRGQPAAASLAQLGSADTMFHSDIVFAYSRCLARSIAHVAAGIV